MKAISATFCRDRRPDSRIAPLQPLPAEDWARFRSGVLSAMERHIPARETEVREGHTVWDGREEYCVTVTRAWAEPTPEQMDQLRARLAELAADADQAAVVLHIEERELVTAA